MLLLEGTLIEFLNLSQAAYFYAPKRALSASGIQKMFRAIRGNAQNPTRSLFCHIRERRDGTRFSAICFSFERKPSFLDAEARVIERVFGALMIVEHSGHIAIMKAGLDITSTFRSTYLSGIPNERVEQAIAQQSAVFEQLRLKNLSSSKHAVRSKTFEANDLANSVPTSSANRFAPLGYRVRRDDGSYSATPSTGRISMRADRADYEEIIAWTSSIIVLLEANNGESASFIRNFARPQKLNSLPNATRPTYLAIDVPALADLLLEDDTQYRLIRETENGPVELDANAVGDLLMHIDESFPLSGTNAVMDIGSTDGQTTIGKIRLNKARIALLQLELAALDGILIEDRDHPIGEDPEQRILVKHINQADMFTVLFNELELAYVNGTLFRDPALVGGGENFLAHLRPEPSLEDVDSEKGAFEDQQLQFSEGSVFRAVADQIANDCDVLICDDLGDEWADFVGLSTNTSPSTVSFYHAKHGADSLGASPFHEAVGQALKNLGNMSLPAGAMARKLNGWEQTYNNDNAETSIDKIMRGGGRPDIEQAIGNTRSAPDLAKRVFIVTSSLSRARVAQVFVEAAAGQAPSAHFVQLYWLLTNYFAACKEMGATGYIICRP